RSEPCRPTSPRRRAAGPGAPHGPPSPGRRRVTGEPGLRFMTFSLRCHPCQTLFAPTALWVSDRCLGRLEVAFDYDAVSRAISRAAIEAGPRSLWRYRDLLPIEGEPRTGLYSGFTPLVRADRLAARLGVK